MGMLSILNSIQPTSYYWQDYTKNSCQDRSGSSEVLKFDCNIHCRDSDPVHKVHGKRFRCWTGPLVHSDVWLQDSVRGASGCVNGIHQKDDHHRDIYPGVLHITINYNVGDTVV